jgi:lysophospholipase III
MRSRIDAKLTDASTSRSDCCTNSAGFYNLFVNPDLMTSYGVECWVNNIRLHYDNATKKTSNTPGVETRIPGFGDPKVVEQLDPTHVN